jgi:hypothetical protein
VIGGAVIFAVLAVVGIWTGIGLYRLRPWARIAILVIAGIMCVTGLLALAVFAVVPIPIADVDEGTLRIARRVILATYGLSAVIGAWWLVQFNVPATKGAFTANEPVDPSRLPLSIAIIGWFNVVGGVLTVLAALFRPPAFLFGATFTGWAAALFYLFVGGVSIYLGRGVLRLDERARILTIAWFGFTTLHMAFIALSPIGREGLREMEELAGGSGVPLDSARLLTVMFVFSVALFAAAAWPLVTNRGRFVRSGAGEDAA